MKPRWGLWGLCALTLLGCEDFPTIEANTCGNAVIEPPEDCDTFVVSSGVKGAVCRPKGVVGECHWDCRADADGVRAPCPSGYGCAADGICRKPSDAFQAPIRLSSEPSSWLSAADFDGDGRADVISTEPADEVQQARFRLHYFDADTQLVETRTFPRVTTRPIAYTSADEHAKSALIFSNFRIGMLPGRADREWVPASFSSYVVDSSSLTVVSVRDDLVGGASALVAITARGGAAGLYVPSFETGQLDPRYLLTRPISELMGVPLVVEVVEGSESPCKELLLTYRSAATFRVLDMCRLGNGTSEPDVVWRAEPRIQDVRLPPGAKIDAAPIAADLDGDGHQDVIIGSRGKAYVAYGNGAGLADAVGPLSVSLIGQETPLELPMPLAAGDISGDHIADFVIPTAMVSSRRSPVDGSIGFAGAYANHDQPWSMAAVVDLNHNGLPDVVAAAEGAPNVTFLNGNGTLFPVAAQLSTRGPVRMLTTGDFDGDLIQDLAYLERGPRDNSPDSLAIAFGAVQGVPLPAARIAELSGADQLGQTRDFGLDSLFVASHELVHGREATSLTLFDGSADRLPFAPYTLVPFAQSGNLDDSAALAVTVGGFTAPGASDVIALGAHDPRQDYSLWLAPHITGDKTPPRQLMFEKVKDALPVTQNEQDFRLSLATVGADLDGDGLDELVGLMPQGPTDCALFSYDIDGPYDSAELKDQLSLGEPCPAPELGAVDFDRDGRAELLLLLIGDPEQGPRRLTLVSDLRAGFAQAQRGFIDGPGGRDVRGFSAFPQSDEFGIRIALVTDSALHVARSGRVGNVYDDVREVRKFTDARSVVVADPNGDHIPDIVVADAEGLWLLEAGFQ